MESGYFALWKFSTTFHIIFYNYFLNIFFIILYVNKLYTK